MKKDDALDKLERAGHTIHNAHASAWNTALNPTQYGWGKSIIGIASIPVLSAASIGQLVSHAVVRQMNPDTFEKMTDLGGKPDDKPKP